MCAIALNQARRGLHICQHLSLRLHASFYVKFFLFVQFLKCPKSAINSSQVQDAIAFFNKHEEKIPEAEENDIDEVVSHIVVGNHSSVHKANPWLFRGIKYATMSVCV